MFSLQRILGQDDEFCALLEASAQEACQSVATLKRVLADRSTAPTLEAFASARRKEKQLTNEIAELLIRAFVTAMEREDIEALAETLYKIPKTVEKFAERYMISAIQMRDVDFSRQIDLMERAVNTVLQMVKALRAGTNIAGIKQLNANIQKIESDADDLILELIGRLYVPGFPPLKGVIVKDLFELNEKVVDRCRDAGNVITRVVLKNS
jgi:hypothetical protein